MRTNFSKRLRFLSFGILCFALVLVVKLYFVQVVHGDAFSQKADRQYVRSGELVFDRGSIFFEDKEKRLISAATLKNGYIIAISPNVLEDTEKVYESVNNILPIDRADFFFKAGKKNDPYEEIAKHVDEPVAKSIDDLDIKGLSIYKERWRFYPGQNLASQVIGFIGYNKDKTTGLYGLERQYNETLSRNEGEIYVNFFAEIFSNINSAIGAGKKEKEGDIILTIDPVVQDHLETELRKVSEKWGATQVAGIIMNPQNGEIKAMGVTPSFDINNFREVRDPEVFKNPIVESVYEMGSIIKPLTMAAGLDSGAVTAATTYDDKGFLIIDGARISNFDKKGRGVVPMQEVLNQSLNTGVSFVVKRMGNKSFSSYMKAYGLGEKTGIDLPGEVQGLIGNLNSPRDVEYATASFGQGIALTPIATVRALATLGNGGKLITPHVVKKIDYKNGFSNTVSHENSAQVLKKETSEEITRMLVKVVDEALLNGQVKMDRYSIAAKTGTAQMVDKQTGKYYEDRYLHSFFGYFPAYDPEFIIFLYALEPKARYASETLTHPFIDTAKFLINYYEIPPDR